MTRCTCRYPTKYGLLGHLKVCPKHPTGTITIELRRRLHREMRRTGITQLKLSQKSGVSRAAVNHLLCGYRDGRIATWQQLFDTLSEIPSAPVLFDIDA